MPSATRAAASAPVSPEADAKRLISVPAFAFTVSSVLKTERKETGAVAGNYELVRDVCGTFYLRPVGGEQTSFFDN